MMRTRYDTELRQTARPFLLRGQALHELLKVQGSVTSKP